MNLREKFKNNIFYYTNVIEDPQEIIDMVERLDTYPGSYSAIPKWEDWKTSNDDGVLFGKKKDISIKNLDTVQKELGKDVLHIANTINSAIERVSHAFYSDIGKVEHPAYSKGLRMSKYLTGASMGPHYDVMDGDSKIEYSILIYYNDNYDGGEVSFMISEEDILSESYTGVRLPLDGSDPFVAENADLFIKPEAGSVLIFPSTKPYYHQVHLLRGGEKYISPGFIYKNSQ